MTIALALRRSGIIAAIIANAAIVSLAQEAPDSFTQVAEQCPTELARVTPCIDTNTSVAVCTTCLADSVFQNGNVTGIPTECSEIEDLICDGLAGCGPSCGLSTTGSAFLTFGSDCDDLFVELVGCVVQSQGVGANCTFGGSDACPGSVSSSFYYANVEMMAASGVLALVVLLLA